jgi:hypothetical protein
VAVRRQGAVPPGRLDHAWRPRTRRRYWRRRVHPATGHFFALGPTPARATAAERILAVAVGTVVAAVAIGFAFLPAAPVPSGQRPTARYLTNQTISQNAGALSDEQGAVIVEREP